MDVERARAVNLVALLQVACGEPCLDLARHSSRRRSSIESWPGDMDKPLTFDFEESGIMSIPIRSSDTNNLLARRCQVPSWIPRHILSRWCVAGVILAAVCFNGACAARHVAAQHRHVSRVETHTPPLTRPAMLPVYRGVKDRPMEYGATTGRIIHIYKGSIAGPRYVVFDDDSFWRVNYRNLKRLQIVTIRPIGESPCTYMLEWKDRLLGVMDSVCGEHLARREHRIAGVLQKRGAGTEIIRLEDGSVWKFLCPWEAQTWAAGDTLSVDEHEPGVYYLVNHSRRDSALALLWPYSSPT